MKDFKGMLKNLRERKVRKSLSVKDISQYNCLDKILEYYLCGNLQKQLESFRFKKFKFMPI